MSGALCRSKACQHAFLPWRLQACQPHGLGPEAARVQDFAERRALRGELRTLAKEERSRQQKAIGEVTGGALRGG